MFLNEQKRGGTAGGLATLAVFTLVGRLLTLPASVSARHSLRTSGSQSQTYAPVAYKA